MSWRQLHRWLGLVAGSVALVLAISGTILASDPLRDAWSAAPAQADLPVSVLAQRVAATVPGVEEIRRLPSGEIVVYAFDGGVWVVMGGHEYDQQVATAVVGSALDGIRAANP